MIESSRQRRSHLASTLAAAALALPLAPLRAQDTAPQFVANEWLGRFGVHDLPAFLAAADRTPLGPLVRDPDVMAAFALGEQRLRALVDGWIEVAETARRDDPALLGPGGMRDVEMFRLGWRDVKSLYLQASMDEAVPVPRLVATLEPTPRSEGRCAQALTRVVTALETLPDLKRAPDAAQKAFGYPAHVFVPAGEQPARSSGPPPGIWYLHLPGQIVVGDGDPESSGKVGDAPPAEPGLDYEFRPRRLLAALAPGGMIGAELKVFEMLAGAETATIGLHVRVRGDRLQEELRVQGPTADLGGLLGALARGTAPLVGQPLLDDTLLQLRVAFDVGLLEETAAAIAELAGLGPEPPPILAEVGKAWNGSVALGVAAPAPGGVVPRLLASFGVADAARARALLTRLAERAEITAEAVEYHGLACTRLRIDGAPPAIEPTWAIADGVLHVAESAPSMRAFAAALAERGAATLDVGDAPLPVVAGELRANFDLRYDGGAIWRNVSRTWLPLAQLAAAAAGSAPTLLAADDMPDVDTVADALGCGRGVLATSDDTMVLAVSGVAGGPEVQALLAVFPVVAVSIATEWERDTARLIQRVAERRGAALGAALAAWRDRHGALPPSLGALVAAGGLTDLEALTIPGVADSDEPVVHAGRELCRSSWRYLPTPVSLELRGEQREVVLIQLRSRSHTRAFVTADGELVTAYGRLVQTPVDDIPGVESR